MTGKKKPDKELNGQPPLKARVTQGQIARELGFSQSIVSKVLNGQRQRISEESYEKIWNYARSRGYRMKGILPEFIPKSAKTGTVGYLLRSGVKLYNQNPFFAHVQHGLHDYLAEQGLSLIFLGTENDFQIEKLNELNMNPHLFRGLVIMGEVARPFLQDVKKNAHRIVSVAAQYPGFCDSVCSNDEHSSELIVRHLLDFGHHNFAWLGGNKGMQRSRNRLGALRNSLRLRELVIHPEYCVELEGDGSIQGRQAAEAILKASASRQMPTAWICFSAAMARGAVNFLLQQGIGVPQDISVLSFDNTRICVEDIPTLTGTGTTPEKLGRFAGELLLQDKTESCARYLDAILPAELFERESTGPGNMAKTHLPARPAPAKPYSAFVAKP